MATGEKKLFGSPDVISSSGAITAGVAAVTLPAPGAGKRYLVRDAIISAGGTVTAARATLTWTQNGVVQTIGVVVSIGIWQIFFSANPIVTDDNTSVTLSIPSLGAGGIGEATLVADSDQI